ncbi:hypothetical protein MRB53_006006 [Persea americana]|uniref:Uncharacterized protein n=1 Tax=Persea americana TaxID=3435 RepID=A0ACC2MF83_PERAE|nr:hypothetical protein MRB53_006006 [Persea americana]
MREEGNMAGSSKELAGDEGKRWPAAQDVSCVAGDYCRRRSSRCSRLRMAGQRGVGAGKKKKKEEKKK